MNCSYCGRQTDNPPERIGNVKTWVCDRVQCQQEAYTEERKTREAEDRYDEWKTRGED